MKNQTLNELLEKLNLIELSNRLRSDSLDIKTNILIALSVAANQKNNLLVDYFSALAKENNSNQEEIAEAIACASLLSANNVFYRFRHFMNSEEYNKIPAGVKMNIMMNPVTGKKAFELMSLAVSAVNGCEQCVLSHEDSLIKLGFSKSEIFEGIRTASIVCSLDKIIF
jgi:lipoyl-dependent peroxiredoxin subunit D